MATLAPVDGHGRASRSALLRTEPGSPCHLHQPASLAARLPTRRRRRRPPDLLARYLHAYGPATPRHFAQWLNVPPRSAADLFDELADDLEQVEIEGAPRWVVAGDSDTPDSPTGASGCCPTSTPSWWPASLGSGSIRAPPRDRALSPSGQAGNYPVLLVDGVVGGVWHQRRSGRRLAVTVEPLSELTTTQRRQLGEEVDLLGEVTQAKPTLTLGAVTVGAHA